MSHGMMIAFAAAVKFFRAKKGNPFAYSFLWTLAVLALFEGEVVIYLRSPYLKSLLRRLGE